jgi:signal transduction histidine kinase
VIAPSALPGARRFWLVAVVLIAATLIAAVVLVDRVAEHQVSELQAYAAGGLVDRLSLVARDEGRAALLQSVNRAMTSAAEGQIFLVADAAGGKLGGNLARWPAGVGLEEDWKPMRLADGRSARAITASLPDGDRLLVGQTDDSRRPLRIAVAKGAAVALLAMLVIVGGLGLTLNRAVSNRVATLSSTIHRILTGDRSARATVGGSADVFDDLAVSFNAMLDENERLMIGLRSVTDSLAHDLRTPLTRVVALIEQAQVSEKPAEQAQLLESAQNEARFAASTFAALIDLARAETGLSRDAMEVLDLADLVNVVGEIFGPLVEDRGHALKLHVEAASLHGHRQLLLQALGNLLENAAKYAPRGGAIELGVARVGDAVDLYVRDYGPGLSPAETEEAVRPFARLARHHDHPGAGLGLAIAAAVARLHGGRLLLEDAQPGLRARLHLPITQS